MLPEAFLTRMQRMLQDEYSDFLASYDKPRFQALRFGSAPDENAARLTRVTGWHLQQVPWEPCGFCYDACDRPGKHPYHEAGLYYIQEPSAMGPAHYLDARPGEIVLDLCAAPGGKSTQIAASMKGGGLLISNEIVPNRAKILSENIERMGIPNAIVTSEDPDTLACLFPHFFDRIMVDAPCSGEGMFRKSEEAQAEWSEENVALCADRDDTILDAADRMLIPGGRLVFSTCTFAPAENEGSIARFLTRHPDYRIKEVPLAEGMSHGIPEWAYDSSVNCRAAATPDVSTGGTDRADLANTIRLWPHKLNGEGHFIAVLEKTGTPVAAADRSAVCGRARGLREKQYADFMAFASQTLTLEAIGKLTESGSIIRFGDQLYHLPEYAPCLDHLKVVRPGLHLGTMKKNRFEPSHALAHALGASDVLHSASLHTADIRPAASDHALPDADPPSFTLLPAGTLDVSDFSAERWIGGETFRTSGENGWYLITVDGIHLGWGKLAGGTMKNHYPRGLRRNL